MSEKLALPALSMAAELMDRLPSDYLMFLLRRLRKEKLQYTDGQARFNTFFPPYPSMAFDRMVETLAAGRRAPLSTYFAVTSVCPWKCAHCSYGKRPPRHMNRGQQLEVIASLKRLGGHTIGFTGGEPMLCNHLEELIAAARPEMCTVVFTTGIGLDEARAKRLASVGVDNITIGFDSSNPAEHDAARGASGSFEHGRRAVEICLAAGIHTAISTVAFREKMQSGELERMYQMGQQWGANEFRVIPPVPTGGIAGCKATTLTAEEMRELAQFHLDHNALPDGPSMACFAYLESAEMFGCGAGYHHVFIDAMGQVCPCDLTPLSFGDVTKEPLDDIWQRMEEHFPLPRCTCLMRGLGPKIPADADLPLAPEISRQLCPHRAAGEPLPEGYRLLLDGDK